MSGFYPFDKEHIVLYDKDDFIVALGYGSKFGGWHIGMRWKSSMEGKNGYPVTRSGDPCYFLISEELAAGLLETLPSLGEPKDGQRKEAIKKLKGEDK